MVIGRSCLPAPCTIVSPLLVTVLLHFTKEFEDQRVEEAYPKSTQLREFWSWKRNLDLCDPP